MHLLQQKQPAVQHKPVGKLLLQMRCHTMQPDMLFRLCHVFQAVPVDPVLPELKASGVLPCSARASLLASVPGM